MTAPVVYVHGVQHRLAERFTLHVPSLTLSPGVTAVLGANGCGKTTLLRVLATVIAPQHGDVVVGGTRVTDEALAAVRRRLGYLPQDDSVPRRLAVFDHVDLVAVMREIDADTRRRRAAVHRALADVQLSQLAAERCGRLSGGQRRRVALAAALAGDAPYLVLDEPDAHLDNDQRAHLGASLRRRAADATIIIATHDHTWAATIADRTITMHDGVIAG